MKISTPHHETVPFLGMVNPHNILSNVVFPEPFVPWICIISPAPSSRDIDSNKIQSPLPPLRFSVVSARSGLARSICKSDKAILNGRVGYYDSLQQLSMISRFIVRLLRFLGTLQSSRLLDSRPFEAYAGLMLI